MYNQPKKQSTAVVWNIPIAVSVEDNKYLVIANFHPGKVDWSFICFKSDK